MRSPPPQPAHNDASMCAVRAKCVCHNQGASPYVCACSSDKQLKTDVIQPAAIHTDDGHLQAYPPLLAEIAAHDMIDAHFLEHFQWNILGQSALPTTVASVPQQLSVCNWLLAEQRTKFQALLGLGLAQGVDQSEAPGTDEARDWSPDSASD